MPRWNPVAALPALLMMYVSAPLAAAADGACRLVPAGLERGEERDLLLCGPGLGGVAPLAGLEGSGLEVLYQQSLRACAPGERDPGLHLVVRAGAEARSARLDPRRGDGTRACDEALSLDVPQRHYLGAVTLRPVRGAADLLDLRVRSPAGLDLRAACAPGGLHFDAGDGPQLALAAPPRCRVHRLDARLRVRGEQLQPARVLLRVRSEAQARDALVLARRPDPPWHRALVPQTARFVDVDGVRTRYFDVGRGPPLVLVHGGQAGGENNHAEVWQQVVPELARHFRVIVLDRLAQGATGALPEATGYAHYYAHDARHLHRFIATLGLRDVTLVGHSQGGYPVTAVALDHPQAVRCLVNVDTVLVPDDPAPMRAALGFIVYLATALHGPEGPSFYSARRSIRLRGPSGHNVNDAEAARIVAQYRDPRTRATRARMAAERMTPLNPAFKALRDEAYRRIAAGEIAARHLVVWGAADPQVPLALGLRFYESLAASRGPTALHVIGNAGHFPFAEHPGEFSRVVTAFCAP